MYDLIIIGGSAAGTASAIYAARRKLHFLILAIDLGGEVALSGEVENYPGIPQTTGVALAEMFQKHQEHYQVPKETGVRVIGIQKIDGNGFQIVAEGDGNGERKTYETKSIIIATGAKPKYVNIPGEKEFYLKGVTYCTVCDGPLYKGKITATIGTGNSALESALMMAEIAKQHYVLLKHPEFRGDVILIDKLKEKKNVTVLPEALTQKIIGEKFVKELVYQDKTGTAHTLTVDGIFVHIGMTPQSSFAKIVEQTEKGDIITDKLCRTSVPGIFAAGDVTDIPYYQIGIATGTGITAALGAIEYVNKWK